MNFVCYSHLALIYGWQLPAAALRPARHLFHLVRSAVLPALNSEASESYIADAKGIEEIADQECHHSFGATCTGLFLG